MSDNKNRRDKVVVVCAIRMSVLHCLVWPHMLYDFVEVKDRQAWLQGREWLSRIGWWQGWRAGGF